MEVIYWNDKIERFIKDLGDELSMRVERVIDLLEGKGHLLDMPDSKSLGKGLFELRTHGKNQIRLLYIYKNDKAYIVHGFIKKAWKISKKDIDYARKVQKEVERLA